MHCRMVSFGLNILQMQKMWINWRKLPLLFHLDNLAARYVVYGTISWHPILWTEMRQVLFIAPIPFNLNCQKLNPQPHQLQQISAVRWETRGKNPERMLEKGHIPSRKLSLENKHIYKLRTRFQVFLSLRLNICSSYRCFCISTLLKRS